MCTATLVCVNAESGTCLSMMVGVDQAEFQLKQGSNE